MPPSVLTRFANPRRFRALADRVLPLALLLALVGFGYGLWLALVASPPDYQQGETVRIMYVHVPAAWMALSLYAAMGIAAFMGIVWRHTLAFLFCRAAAPVGLTMTGICLATGSLWGEPMWGTWWVWDARLTSVLVLFFFYLGYIALAGAFEEPEAGDRAGAILLLVGLIDLPIVKFSVDWWATLHQGESLFRSGGPTIAPAMLAPLFIMALGYLGLTAACVIWRLRAVLAERRTVLARQVPR